MQVPKFSIITVVYNGEGIVDKTMSSVAEQTFNDYEHIIIDGRSSDKTLEIVEHYKSLKLIVVSEKDKGIYDAMNKGVKIAKGQYLIFMNAGDCFVDMHTLSRVSEQLDGVHHFYGDSIRIYNGESYLNKEKVNSFSITRHNICHQSIFYLRKQSIHYDLKYMIFADWVLNIKEFCTCGFKHICTPVCQFSMDGISSTTERMKDKAFMDDLPALSREYLGFFQFLYVKIRFIIRQYV